MPETHAPVSSEEHRTLPAAEPGSSEALSLGIRDVILLVNEKNEKIMAQRLEVAISREAIKGAWSIFEPEMVGSYRRDDAREKYTEEDKAKLLYAFDELKEANHSYNLAVEELVLTGGRLNVGYTMKEISNNFNQDTGDEYQTTVGMSITQPLLKNAGIKTTMTDIRLAEADAKIALQTYRLQMMQIVSKAAAAYWNLYLAQERYGIRKGSVDIAEQILSDNRKRFKVGKMAETEVLEAEAGLAYRKSLASEARQDLISAVNNVRSYISQSTMNTDKEIRAKDRSVDEGPLPNFESSLDKSFRLRPDYISSRRALEREDIRVAFAKNQRWPQLDLKGSLQLNGLDESTGSSWHDTFENGHKTWAVGLELRLPLDGGKKSRSELEAAKYRKRQALLEIKSLEVSIENGVDAAVQEVYSTGEQVRQYASVVDLDKRLLEVELLRQRGGKSNTRLVLEKEEDLQRAKDAYIVSVADNKMAILALEMAEGSLLTAYGIDIMEDNSNESE